MLLVSLGLVAGPSMAEEYWTDYDDPTGTMTCTCATSGPYCLMVMKVANACSVLRARTQGEYDLRTEIRHDPGLDGLLGARAARVHGCR